jgi:hypothetical protein
MVLIGRIRAAVEAEMRIQGKPLDPPTYTVTTAVGEVETHIYDAESADTPEAKAAYEAYLKATEELSEEQNKRLTRALFRRGVKVDAIPAGWAEELAEDGVIISADPVEQKLEYIQMELLKTAKDIQGAIMAITELSMTGASQEDLKAAQDSFRGRVEGNAAGGTRAEAA